MSLDLDHILFLHLLPDLIQLKDSQVNSKQLYATTTVSAIENTQVILKLLELVLNCFMVVAKLSTKIIWVQRNSLKLFLTVYCQPWTEIHSLVGVHMSTFLLQMNL